MLAETLQFRPAESTDRNEIANMTKALYQSLGAPAGLKLTTSSVWGDADLVVEEGGYEMTDKSGTHIDHGKYIVLWKEENGQWKLYRDIWNSSMPMAPPPATKN